MKRKYKHTLFAFMAVLLLFLIITDVVIVSNQRRQIYNYLIKHRQFELDTVGTFIQDALLKHHYSEVEAFLIRWGNEHDDIVEIHAVTPDGFVLASYRSNKPFSSTFPLEKLIAYSGKNLLTLKVLSDFTSEERILRHLWLQLVAGSAVLMTVLGGVLWFIMKRMALAPMEKEITERSRTEEMLQKTKYELETKVQERTRNLIDANEDLRREIIEKKKSQIALRESEEKYRSVVETSPDMIFITERTTGKIIEVNDAACELLGYSRDEIIGTRSGDRVVSGQRDDYLREFNKLKASGRYSGEYDVVRKDGSHVTVEVRGAQFGEYLIAIGRDISARKTAEEALRLSENKFSKAFRSSPVLMCMTTLGEGRFADVNDAFLEASGFSRDEVIGHTLLELGLWTDLSLREKMVKQLREQGHIHNCEVSFRTKSGEVLTVLWSAEIIDVSNKPYILTVALNITERKKLEAQLVHAQKMEAVGQLAGGIAHDFNNILTAIINNCYILSRRTGDSGPAADIIGKILSLSDTAARITRELLVFSSRQYTKPAPIKLNEVIIQARDFLRNFIGEDIEIRTILTEETLTIMADRHQLEQVIMNLSTNARDAMPGGGVLTVEAGLFFMDENFIRNNGFGEVGKYAVLSISDTGTGMDKETVRKIFDPFFTTKEIGKGTGLGLSIVYGIVKQCGGIIHIDSEPGRGTTFQIYFPEIGSEVEKHKKEKISTLRGDGETILLAEDEYTVRESVRKILEEFNYKIVEAVDGMDAVVKFLEHESEIDLLIFDSVMPKKSGQRAFNEIRGRKPGLKAILTSGYPGDKISVKEIEKSGMVFIPKPLVPEKLLTKIKEMLNGG
ncbi:MAG: PAS domain S-box protein [Nitrospiraceae bacterium]|nr:MAG: PAS domain S-box protein [Nitrospiraceae bacterium]